MIIDDATITDRCVRCEERLDEHSDEGQHCLFQPTTFKGMTMREFEQWLCRGDDDFERVDMLGKLG